MRECGWFLLTQATVALGFAVALLLPASFGLTSTIVIYVLISLSGTAAYVWCAVRAQNLDRRRGGT